MTKIKKRRVLRVWQKGALQYTRIPYASLFMDMRLGKTLVVIRRVKLLGERIKSVLVVCPYSAFYTWKKELYLEGEGIPTEIIGTWQERHKKMWNDGKWFLINKEGFLVLPEIADMSRDWDVVVLDESTFIKNPRAKVTKFFTNNFRSVPYRFILTGMPAPEHPLEYFSQLKFLNTEILGNNYWEFRHKYFREAGYDFNITKPGEKFLSGQLAKYCYFLSRADAGSGEDKQFIQRRIQMPERIKEVYKTLKKEFILEYKGKEIKRTIFAMNAFMLMRRLLGGFAGSRFIFNGKFKELKYLLETELKGQQIVIWAYFIQEIDMLFRKLRNKNYTCYNIHGKTPHTSRERRISEFNRSGIQILIAQPECFRHGVDLGNADTAIYYSTPLGLESRLQSEDRIVQIDKDCLIVDLVVEKSIEISIMKSLAKKESKQMMMKRIVREIQSG